MRGLKRWRFRPENAHLGTSGRKKPAGSTGKGNFRSKPKKTLQIRGSLAKHPLLSSLRNERTNIVSQACSEISRSFPCQAIVHFDHTGYLAVTAGQSLLKTPVFLFPAAMQCVCKQQCRCKHQARFSCLFSGIQ